MVKFRDKRFRLIKKRRNEKGNLPTGGSRAHYLRVIHAFLIYLYIEVHTFMTLPWKCYPALLTATATDVEHVLNRRRHAARVLGARNWPPSPRMLLQLSRFEVSCAQNQCLHSADSLLG